MRCSVDQTSGGSFTFSSCDNQETTACSPYWYRQIRPCAAEKSGVAWEANKALVHLCQSPSSPARQRGAQNKPIHPPSMPGLRQQGMERGGLGQQRREQILLPILALTQLLCTPGDLYLPLLRLPWGKQIRLGGSWPPSTIRTSKPAFTGSFPAHHNLPHDRQGCIQILPSDNIVPYGPYASICWDFSQGRQPPKKKIYLD